MLDARSGARDFFISYRSADGAWAEWIAWEVEAAGYTVFVQAWDFRPGQNGGGTEASFVNRLFGIYA